MHSFLQDAQLHPDVRASQLRLRTSPEMRCDTKVEPCHLAPWLIQLKLGNQPGITLLHLRPVARPHLYAAAALLCAHVTTCRAHFCALKTAAGETAAAHHGSHVRGSGTDLSAAHLPAHQVQVSSSHTARHLAVSLPLQV